MNLRIFTGVWGPYIDTFERGVASSLVWPRNRAAIKGATWTICTEEKNFERVNEIRYRAGIVHGANHRIHGAQDPTLQFSGYLYEEMKRCIDQKSVFLFALPDYVFGDGTVENLKNLMTEPGLCLGVPSTRVLPSAMDRFQSPHTNSELVSLAFDRGYMHQTWRDCEVGKPEICSYYSGTHWFEVEPGLITVMHRLPSSYMAQFIESDINFFKGHTSFSAYDHTWPTKLIEEGRQRYIGSSDVAFITEITEANKNCALTLPVAPGGPSLYHRSLLHHRLNGNIMSVFRKAEHGKPAST